MSELKVYHHELRHNEYEEFYLKSEADKVIAELKKKLDLYKRGFEEADKINAYLYVQLRHHKYKRCLDKSEMCKARYDEEDAMVNGRGASWDYISDKMKFWERWHKRWLGLAEKFKDMEA